MSILIHTFDAVIVGAGLAGNSAARELKKAGKKVAVVTKLHPLRDHLQGDINAAFNDEDSTKLHINDTIKSGRDLANEDAVDLMCNLAPQTIRWLQRKGTLFCQNEDGTIAQRLLNGQSKPRACFTDKNTALTLLQTSYEQACREGVTFFNEWYVIDMIYTNDKVSGVIALNISNMQKAIFNAKAVMFATNGYAKVFKNSSQAYANSGDALSIVARHGIPLEDMEFVQFQLAKLSKATLLISQIALCKGGHLLNHKNERFMEKYAPKEMELATLDIITQAIAKEIQEGNGIGRQKDAILIDLSHLGTQNIMTSLPELRDLALTLLDIDIIKEPILISPAAYFLIGGISCDIHGHVRKDNERFIEGLYVAGECACVGVHGANELSGNATLEALFFGRHVGQTMVKDINTGIKLRVAKLDDANSIINEINFILKNNGTENIFQLRDQLQQGMSDNVGVIRNKQNLEKQLQNIKDLKIRFKNIRIGDKSEIFNIEFQEAIEFGYMLDYSLFIVQAALMRQESRGVHFREDFKTYDDKFLKHSMATLDKDRFSINSYTREVAAKNLQVKDETDEGVNI